MMRFLKYTLAVLLVAGGGLLAGFGVTAYGFAALWWGFPDTWEPLHNLPATPQSVLALDAELSRYLLRTVDGQLFTCDQQGCLSADSDWGSADTRCDDSTRPASVTWFPLFLRRDFDVVLACERAHMDIARTVYVVHLPNEGAWHTIGSGLIPTDAAIIGMGVLGGLMGLVAGLILGGIIIVVRVVRRGQTHPPAAGPVST